MSVGNVTQIVANVATVFLVGFAGWQVNDAAKDVRIGNTIKLMDDGQRLGEAYKNGEVRAPEVVSYFYKAFLYGSSGRLLDAPYKATHRAMCETFSTDPRVQAFWKVPENKKYLDPRFVATVDEMLQKGSCEK